MGQAVPNPTRYMRVQETVFWKKYVKNLQFVDLEFTVVYRKGCQNKKFPLTYVEPQAAIEAYLADLNNEVPMSDELVGPFLKIGDTLIKRSGLDYIWFKQYSFEVKYLCAQAPETYPLRAPFTEGELDGIVDDLNKTFDDSGGNNSGICGC